MVRELAELVDQQVAVLGGTRGTMVQSKQLSAADYRPEGSPPGHRRRSGPAEPHSPDIVLRTRGHHLRPERLAVATGIADHNGYAKTLIASASRKKP
jgi:methionine synthase I (cobalamin-dependent)